MKKSIEWMVDYATSGLDDGAQIEVLFNGERFRIHSISGSILDDLITIEVKGGGVLAFHAASSWAVLRNG